MQNTIYHFLLLSPSLGAEWFFDAARRYWDRFRPTVVSDLALILLIPATTAVRVTVIARRDQIAMLGVQIAQQLPNAEFDPISFDTFEATKAELDRRADTMQAFGLPPLAATATALPEAFIPTPRLATRPPPAVTPNATPTGAATMTPFPPNATVITATPYPPNATIIIVPPGDGDPGDDPRPIVPTIGAVTGG